LSHLFAQPLDVTGEVAPYTSIQPGVQLGFEPSGKVDIVAKAKTSFGDSPDSCSNTLLLRFRAPSRWLTVETLFGWEEIDETRSYQLGFYGTANRALTVRASLRIPRKQGGSSDFLIGTGHLPMGEKAVSISGDFEIEDPESIDRNRDPKLLLALDTVGDLDLRLDYLTAYFV
jgi:hypothetical protein